MNEDMSQPESPEPAEQPESQPWWTQEPWASQQPAADAQPWTADRLAEAAAAEQVRFAAVPFGEMGQPVVTPPRAKVFQRRAAVGAAAAAIGVVAFIATSTASAGNGNLVASPSTSGSGSIGLSPSWSNGTRAFWPGFRSQRQSGLGDGTDSGTSSSSLFGSGTATPATAANLTAAQKAAGLAAEKKVTSDVVDIVSRLSDGIGAGTGIVLNSSGLILTNNHVVDGAEAIQATDVANGKTYTAKLVARDPKADVAVIQLVGAGGLPVATISNTAAAVGDTVTGVGNGLGKGGTPSYAIGTVTGLNKSITATDDGGGAAERVTGMIQSTTGILPGDSGGPLVNTAGQVVGMDTAGEFAQGNDDGPAQESFAIPIATALNIAHELENGTDANGTTSLSDNSGGLLGGLLG